MRASSASVCRVLVVVLMGLLSARGQTPPFTQAPPVGADTSAAILLLIDTDGSLRVFTDPSQGPFDSIEDTLFGVQNNSTKSISAIPLKGSQTIFGFDGDGISSFTGASFGPTGYEGPGVSFSNISADQTAGVVNFNPPIPPGGSAYFALEDAVQTQCPPITPPTRLLQGDPAWSSTQLGGSQNTIGAYGCFITSAAMLINYHAARQGKAFRTDPATFNKWLTANNAYDANGAVRVVGVPIAEYARANGVNLWFTQIVDHRDDFTLDQYLCNNEPPILLVGSPHWVLSTGQTAVNGSVSYSVLDPDSYPNGSTLQGWGNTYKAMELFTDIAGPLAGLYITAHSPVELVLVAPDGATTGLNPLTNVQLSAIPQSGYGDFSSIVNDQDHTQPALPASKTVAVVNPSTGVYALHVYGTGSGPYTLDFVGYDSAGTPTTATITGNASSGALADYTVIYSSAPGSSVTVTSSDATPLLHIVRSGFVRNRGNGHFFQQVTIKNSSTTNAISGPLSLVLEDLSSDATLFNKTGTSTGGSPFVVVNVGVLNPQATAFITLEFSNPTQSGIAYNARIVPSAAP
jgi:hypothetical protein